MSLARPLASGRSFRSLIAAAAAAVVLLLLAAGLRGYRDLATLKDRERRLERDIRAAELRLEELAVEVERRRDDEAMIEKLAREELGLVRPGDVVIVLPRADRRLAPAAAAAPPL